jgi:abequosyltransferase
MSAPLLAICIPTYNMAQWLPDLLDSIVQQLPGFEDDIEVVISDNASTDNTAWVVSNYASRIPKLRYCQHAVNQGADRNFLAAPGMAAAQFCWLFGADDALAPGALAGAVKLLRETPAAVIVTNRICCNVNLTPKREESFFKSKEGGLYDFTSDTDIEAYFAASRSLGAIFSYLSSLIVRREAWNSIGVDESFIGSAYIHVFKVLSILFHGSYEFRKVQHWAFPAVLTRLGNDSFMTQGYVQRFFIDLNGYTRLCATLPPKWRRQSYSIIRSHIKFRRLVKINLFMTNSQWIKAKLLLTECCWDISIINLLTFVRLSLTPFRLGLNTNSNNK